MQGAVVQKYPNIAREPLCQEILGIQATPGAPLFSTFTLLLRLSAGLPKYKLLPGASDAETTCPTIQQAILSTTTVP